MEYPWKLARIESFPVEPDWAGIGSNRRFRRGNFDGNSGNGGSSTFGVYFHGVD
jgi:hypothetical protein